MGKPILTVDVQTRTSLSEWATIGELSRVTEGSFERITMGGYGSGSVSLVQKFNEAGLLTLALNVEKRLVYRLNGTAFFYGYVRRPVKSWQELQSVSVQSIGPVDDTNHVIVKRKFVPPGGYQDLSWFYQQLAKDYILPNGYAARISVETLGVNVASVSMDGTLREALTDLATLGDTFIYWGFSIDDAGIVTFYVRKRNAAADPAYEVPFETIDYDFDNDRYAPAVVDAEYVVDDMDLVNRLFIEGAELRYKNMIVNPSFEDIRQGGGGSNNLLANGDFDDTTNTAWSLYSGASIKSETEDVPHSGTKYLEIDNSGEGARQKVGANALTTYGLDFQGNVEDPFAENDLHVYLTSYQGTLELSVQEFVFLIVDRHWNQYTIYIQTPALSDHIQADFRKSGTGGTEHGILVDTVILYDTSLTYQFGWQLEDTSTPKGDRGVPDPDGLYWVNWNYAYAGVGAISPGPNFGAYGVQLSAYGMTGGKYLRMIASDEGAVAVTAREYYSYAIRSRATQQDGSAPAAGEHLEFGVLWLDKDDKVLSYNDSPLTLTDDWAFYSGFIQAPKNVVKAKFYAEPVSDLIYYFDGFYFSDAPEAPSDFFEGDTAEFVISVADVYDPGDPQYGTLAAPPDGYGPREEKVQNTAVITRIDAERLAKLIFDVRGVLQASGSLGIVQVDTPLTFYAPDGYLLATLDGFTFVKLWPATVKWSYTESGFRADIELEKEVPRTYELLNGERPLSIVALGVSASVPTSLVAPLKIDYTVIDSDPKVTDAGDTFKYALGDYPILESMEAALAGDVMPPSALSMTADDNGAFQMFTISAPDGYTVAEDDKIELFALAFRSGSYASKTEYFAAATTGDNTFTVSRPAMVGSVRAYVNGSRVADSDIALIADTDGANVDVTVNDLTTADDVVVRFIPAPQVTKTYFGEEFVLDDTGSVTLAHVPYRWDGGDYAVLVAAAGKALSTATVSVAGGVASVNDLPTDQIGDPLVVLGNVA